MDIFILVLAGQVANFRATATSVHCQLPANVWVILPVCDRSQISFT